MARTMDCDQAHRLWPGPRTRQAHGVWPGPRTVARPKDCGQGRPTYFGIFRTNPVIFSTNPVIFRTNPVIFRTNPVIF